MPRQPAGSWRRGVAVVSAARRMNEVTLRRARLVGLLVRLTVGYTVSV